MWSDMDTSGASSLKRIILAGALALAGFACAARSQLDVPTDGQESLGVAGDTGEPRLLNQHDLIRAIEREYPPMLRDRLIRGTTNVHILIDEEGIVRDRKVSKSSGHRALDDAALRVVRVARFSPAKNRDEPVALWIAPDITFTPR